MKSYISRIQSSLTIDTFTDSVLLANAGTEYSMLALCVQRYCADTGHSADSVKCTLDRGADSVKCTLDSKADTDHSDSVMSRGTLQDTLISSDSTDSDIITCEVVLDRVWEVLNVGDWKNVAMVWRELYALCSAFLAVLLHLKDKRDKPNLAESVDGNAGLRACDMGLIMGSQHPVLLDLAQYIQEQHDNSHIIKEQGVCTESQDNEDVHRKRPCTLACTPAPSLQIPTKPIPCHSKPSLETFLTLLTSDTPFILDDVITHWPAMERWSPEYIVRRFGERTVPVELGTKYTSSSWSQKLLTLRAFINQYVLQYNPNTGYLAQYDLFSQIPQLRQDIVTPDYCAVSDSEVIVNAWIGPSGTVSPLHYDRYHNLFCQVVGSKRFVLFNPQDELYPHSSHLLYNTSHIDLESVDYEQFPQFRGCVGWLCDIRPGQVLYIPPKWWHFVRALDVSFSVSFWWEKEG